MLTDLARDVFDSIGQAVRQQRARVETVEIATVTLVSSGVAEVKGFTQVSANEQVRFADGTIGIATDLDYSRIGIVLLGHAEGLRMGDDVRRLRRVVDTPVGETLLGRVIDPLGRPLDDKGPLRAPLHRPIERPAPEILARAPVSTPLQTGIKAVDAAIPIGRGQRQLIVGDRQTGKTAVAVDTVLNPRPEEVISVYCAIGQRGDAVARVIDKLQRTGALPRSIIVVASGDDPPGLQFIAPYAATTMAEWFMEAGRDTLVVYDDLTRHARAYRQLSLLLQRPPGREAYPGDIFYIHARLLERATHLHPSRGGGSLTALPIIETQAQNLAAYIPTNLISITDGQIYLSPDLFHKGQLPAIDIGKSVSRVGGRAQLPAFRAVAGLLKLAYSQFEELETFARFGARLDPKTRAQLRRGERVREVLKQAESAPVGVAEQIAVLHAVTQGLFDNLALDQMADAERAVRDHVWHALPSACEALEAGEPLHGDVRQALLVEARRALRQAGLPVKEESDDANA